jgi:hypothetical protein
MSFSTRVGLLAGATALTLTGVSHAGPASNDDLAQRLAAAEAKIAAMEAANNQNWMTEQRAAEIKGLVQDVLADADTRSSLLQGGATSGYDNGFILSSTDGNWLLRLNFLMQQRFIYNNQDELSAEDEDTNRWGFENTRSKLILSGHVVNPAWFYRLDVNFGNNGGNFGGTWNNVNGGDDFRDYTLNAYLGYDYGNGWRMKMGSMKLPFLREELVEAQYQLAIERSIVNYMFTTGYSDGLTAEWNGDRFRVEGSFSDGAQQGQTIWSTMDTEWAFTGRAEFLASGTWDQFKDFTSPRGGETGILIGGAVHWERGEHPSGSNPELLTFTADASAEFGGFNLYGAFVYSDIDFDPGDLNPWGLIFQGGFYLAEDWELYGRFEWVDFDDFLALDDMSLITVGVNKYFAGHNAKWSTDFGYGLDPIIFPANITGWRTDLSDEDGQFVVRTQLQLFF